MITEKLQNAINEQITAEMWSSNLYLAMSFYMDKEGYCGMASWLKKQAHEEHEHACELASYIIKRGGKAKLDKIDVVPNDFGTPLLVGIRSRTGGRRSYCRRYRRYGKESRCCRSVLCRCEAGRKKISILIIPNGIFLEDTQKI